MRTFAIIKTNNEKISIFSNIIQHLPSTDRIIVFNESSNEDTKSLTNVSFVKIPDDCKNSNSKIKNFVTKFFIDENYKGFLHVIEDHVNIFNDPSTFICEIELMMEKLNLKSWFNTTTDTCNYTFNIYNPRFSIIIDDEELKKVYDKTIYWTSHANTSWICYNFINASYSDFEFDERFKIPMFYIIKFLAERRNNKKPGELYYMNFYPTIEDEKNVFNIVNHNEMIFTQAEHVIEHNLFNSLSINYTQDCVIEPIFEDLINILKKN